MLVMTPIYYKFFNKDTKFHTTPASGGESATMIDMKKNEVYGISLQKTSEQQLSIAVYEEVLSH